MQGSNSLAIAKGSVVSNSLRDGGFDEFLAVVAAVSVMQVGSATWFYQCRWFW